MSFILAGIIILISGIGALSGIAKQPLSATEIIQGLSDCKQAGLEYTASSNILIPNQSIQVDRVNLSLSIKSTDMWTEQEKIDYQQRAAQVYDGVYIYNQGCTAKGKTTLFKPAIEHVLLVNALIKCRRETGNDYGIAEEFAVISIDALTNEITGIECRT